MYWYMKVLKNYTNFKGRAARQEFWWFFLINLLIIIALGLVDTALGTTYSLGEQQRLAFSAGILTSLYNLFILLPTIALGVRRLHDFNARGWWMLVTLIPYVGGLLLLVAFIFPGQEGDNRFGPPAERRPGFEGAPGE